jgi:hypothetical protein
MEISPTLLENTGKQASKHGGGEWASVAIDASMARIISIGECGPWNGFATRMPPFNAGVSVGLAYTDLTNTKFTRNYCTARLLLLCLSRPA